MISAAWAQTRARVWQLGGQAPSGRRRRRQRRPRAEDFPAAKEPDGSNLLLHDFTRNQGWRELRPVARTSPKLGERDWVYLGAASGCRAGR